MGDILSDTQKDFNQDYLNDKLHAIGDKLGDAYGEPLLSELIKRMERTVAHFNEEVDVMVNTLSSRTKNQKKLLASMRGEDPNLIDVELSDLEKKLESKDQVKSDSKDTKENDKPKKKKFSFFNRKKKK
ncbi:MAG: hypothetical protein HN653_05685 [Candidatus Marinimicrobia bacterium]|jgi:hypothetical protein|nr:hypothetical protein [Candidatus Neomarinimicrobiota bacterium]MBT7525149.1 hypothetical protein [Candidatus Neomarinimicrobiota bacterium]|tara:strand:+ start:10006 stop:10392 length:387 start_codon:yes stop_codon:yes gene_type:complete